MTDLEGLPAAERVDRGLRDLAAGAITVDSLLLAVASRRLADLGLAIPANEELPRDPELALYARLCSLAEDPYFAYRAALDELDSFVLSLEARRRTS